MYVYIYIYVHTHKSLRIVEILMIHYGDAHPFADLWVYVSIALGSLRSELWAKMHIFRT